ncbi:MAG: HEAT repeat domain-containing protein [Terriglobia bacterium]
MMVLPTPNLSLLTSLARAVLATVTVATLALAVGAMVRRWHHNRFDRRVKSLRTRYAPTLARLLAGKHSAQCLASLRTLPLSSLELLLEPLLLKCVSAPALATVLEELCLELGLIDVWQRRVLDQFGPLSLREALSNPDGLLHFFSRLHFLLRARSARNLGLLRHQPSWPILVKALDDPHPDVQQVALRSLAAIREPQSFPALLDRMHKAVTENRSRLSLYSLKVAMAKFPLSQAPQLLPSLRHPHPRVRSAAAEILREMAKSEPAGKPALLQYKSVFDRELATLTSDADPEVRALAAEVIAHLDTAVSSSVLRQVLQDPQWSVRRDALQTLAQRPGLLPMAEVQGFLTDPHRMVRQAALRALLAYGREGVSKLYEHFLETEDETLRVQILEELQHAGLVLSLLQNYGESPGNLETRVVERLVTVGAARYLYTALSNSSGRQLLQILFEVLGERREPKIEAWVRLCAALDAAREPDQTAYGHSKLAT